MKNWILWSFSRGSFQYDVLCGLILVAIFAIPPGVFNDRPDYMRLPGDSEIHRSIDDDQNNVYTVKVVEGVVTDPERAALVALQVYLDLDSLPETFRVEPVRDAWGRTAAYAFWMK
jgi:hypothetical protein